jgi:glycosyltransferase involved in cell wall biosynthesis
LSWLWAGLTLHGKVVHAQWWSYALAPVYIVTLMMARIRARRVVMTLHNLSPHNASWWQRTLYRLVFRLADQFVVHSELNRRAFLKAYPVAHGRVSVVPMGMHANEGAQAPADARRALGLSDDAFIVLAFGNIRPYKGIDVLLQALRRLIDEGHDVVVLIAGKPWGSFEPYQRLIEELCLQDHVVTRLEYVSDAEIPVIFGAADLAVYPYTAFDAQSAAATLALAFGLPLIVSDVGGLPDFAEDERAIVPPSNTEALATAIARVMTDSTLRDAFAATSRRLAGQLGWDDIAEKTIDTYRGLAAAPTAAALPATGGNPWR